MVKARSSMSTLWARRLPPAAPTLMNRARVLRAQAAMAVLACTWSHASMTASTGPGSKAGQLADSTKSSMQVTSHAGLICTIRSRMANTLAWPRVLSSAWIWRLMLDSATWSRSISVRRPTPLRAKASAAHDPTPPTPTTTTCAARMWAAPSRPYRRSRPPNRRCRNASPSSGVSGNNVVGSGGEFTISAGIGVPWPQLPPRIADRRATGLQASCVHPAFP